MGNYNQSISAGLGGFLAAFLLGCALWLLMRNMNKHLRNVSYQEERERARAQAARQARATSGAAAAPGEVDAGGAERTAAGSGDSGDLADSGESGDSGESVQTRPRSLAAGYPKDATGPTRER